MTDTEVAVVGAGVVGCAAALALSRSGVSVLLLEAEAEPGLGASGANSGILHVGFDSHPGELETRLILRSAELRDAVLDALGIPVLRCGAVVRPSGEEERRAVAALSANAEVNGVEARLRGDGALEVPGEAVTNPVAYTLALAAAAERNGAELRTAFRVGAIESTEDGLSLESQGGDRCAAAPR